MKVVIPMLILISWSFVAANGEGVFPLKDVKQDPKKTDIDLLNHPVCNHLRENGFCKTSSHIKNKLCHATCRCDDLLVKKSCDFIKRKNKCHKDLAVLYCKWTCGLCQSCKATAPLGMQSRAIPDSRITASSIYNSAYLPQQARLHYKPTSSKKRGSWAAKYRRVGEWLQVDLGKVTMVTSVETQGRYDGNEWVKSYILQYSNDGKTFKSYQSGKVFKGNSDRHTVVKHALRPFITARYIRVVAKSWHSYISMRMELYGCKQ